MFLNAPNQQVDQPVVVLFVVNNLDIVPLRYPFPCKIVDNRCNFITKVVGRINRC
jgi:hypothetical protein